MGLLSLGLRRFSASLLEADRLAQCTAASYAPGPCSVSSEGGERATAAAAAALSSSSSAAAAAAAAASGPSGSGSSQVKVMLRSHSSGRPKARLMSSADRENSHVNSRMKSQRHA